MREPGLEGLWGGGRARSLDDIGRARCRVGASRAKNFSNHQNGHVMGPDPLHVYVFGMGAYLTCARELEQSLMFGRLRPFLRVKEFEVTRNVKAP